MQPWRSQTAWLLRGGPIYAMTCVQVLPTPLVQDSGMSTEPMQCAQVRVFDCLHSSGAWPPTCRVGDPVVTVEEVSDLKIADVRKNEGVLQACFILCPVKTPSASELAAAVDKLLTAHGLHTQEDA